MRSDFLLDQDDDLRIENGDLVTGSSAEQEAYLCALSFKGEWRQWPMAGFGMASRLKKRVGSGLKVENTLRFKRDLIVELEADGHTGVTVIVNDSLTNFEIKVNP